VPSAGIFESPCILKRVNVLWLAHILGVVEGLAEYAAWQGDNEDVQRAIGEIHLWLQNEVDMCEELANCVENSDVFKSAFMQFALDNSVELLAEMNTNNRDIYNPQTTTIYQISEANNNDLAKSIDIETCDKNEILGIAESLVDGVIEMNLDMLEFLVSFTDEIRRISALVGMIPVIGTVVQNVLNSVAAEIPNLRDAFVAIDTEQLRLDLSLEVYCLLVENCEIPTKENLVNIWRSRMTEFIDFEALPLQQVLSAIVTRGIVLGDEFRFWAMNTLGCYFLVLGITYAGYRSGAIDYFITRGKDEPRSYWGLALCESDWEQVFNFTSSNGGWTAYNAYASYSSGNGWQRGSTVTRLGISSIAITTVISYIKVEYSSTYADSSASGSQVVRYANASNSAVGDVLESVASGTELWTNYEIGGLEWVFSNQRLNLGHASNSGFSSPSIPTSFRITKVTLRGYGSNPFL
jgi:hypothetical protein